MSAARPTLLCVGNFDRGTGYAWDTIRGVWRSVARELELLGVQTLAVYRQPPAGAGSGGGSPIREIASGWRTWDDLVSLVRSHGVDACWLTDTALIGRRYSRLRRAGARFVVVHERTSGDRTIPRGFKRGLKRLLGRRPAWTADRYIAISDFVRRRLLDSGCLPEAKVTRVYNAVDLDRWTIEANPAAARERLGLPPASRLVACACRAQRYKGVNTLITAMTRLAPHDGQGRPIHAVYCGDGPDLEIFKARVLAEGIAERFHLLGRRSDVREWILSADAVVVPSHWHEGFGLAVAEGLAAGRPVVASAVGAIPELIRDGVTGLLVPPGDPEALARALGRVLDDPAAALRMGEAGRADARSRFGMPRLAGELADLFASGLGFKR